MENASVAIIVKLLKSFLPVVESVLEHAAENDGWFKFPLTVTQTFVDLKVGGQVALYGNELLIPWCIVSGLLGESVAKDIFAGFGSMNAEGAFEEGEQLILALDHASNSFPRLPKTEAEAARAKAFLDALSPEERAAAIRQWQIFLWGLLAAFYQWLSIMVHGEKLTVLVARALRGDDDALVKAVQIDRDLLGLVEAFCERRKRAEFGGDQDFLDKLAYRIKNPIAKGKIQQPLLWLSFAVLDALGHLGGSVSNRELLAIVDQVGLDLVQDERSFVKVLKSYREYKDRSVVSST